MTVYYTAPDLPHDRVRVGDRRWRILTALRAGPQTTPENRRDSDNPAKSNRQNRKVHWLATNEMIQLGWIACKAGVMRLRSEGREALQRAEREAAWAEAA